MIRWVRWFAMARAPGGNAGADSPSVYRDTGRLVAFSDAVFAITITLLVLEIRPPNDYGNLLHGLLALWPSYLAYGVTFLFIGQVWAKPPRRLRPHSYSGPGRTAAEHLAADGRRVPSVRYLCACGGAAQRARRASRRPGVRQTRGQVLQSRKSPPTAKSLAFDRFVGTQDLTPGGGEFRSSDRGTSIDLHG
jgi:hypothetical protein